VSVANSFLWATLLPFVVPLLFLSSHVFLALTILEDRYGLREVTYVEETVSLPPASETEDPVILTRTINYIFHPEAGVAYMIIASVTVLAGLTAGAIIFVSGCIRRLHDIGQSGIWLLVSIPTCGLLFLWVFLLLARGSSHSNAYGPPV